MHAYAGFVMILNCLVDLLLICGTNRLLGESSELKAALSSAAVGAAYAGASLLASEHILTGLLVRVLVLLIMSLVAYGKSVRKMATFVLLMLTVGGITNAFVGIGAGETVVAVICMIVQLLFAKRSACNTQIVPIELAYRGKTLRTMALRDTGNGLCDPITGESVIVVSPHIAWEFMGFTKEQLSQPMETLPLLPGGRLIPYRAVGTDSGMLMAVRFPMVKIGKNTTSALVAFAPAGFQDNGGFQALVGRTL